MVPYFESCRQDWTNQFYGRYEIRRFAFNAEYRRSLRDQLILNGSSADVSDARGWYVLDTAGRAVAETVDALVERFGL